MSIKQIIQESINQNPMGLKEALAEELRARVAVALESKMNEDLDQIDEISGKTLGSYISKARAQDKAKIEHGKKLDSDPKVAELKTAISARYKARDYTKRNQNAINKGHDDVEKRKKKIDPAYPASAYPKRSAGIGKALNKLTYGKLTDSNENFDTPE